jgi:hypothetical protein
MSAQGAVSSAGWAARRLRLSRPPADLVGVIKLLSPLLVLVAVLVVPSAARAGALTTSAPANGATISLSGQTTAGEVAFSGAMPADGLYQYFTPTLLIWRAGSDPGRATPYLVAVSGSTWSTSAHLAAGSYQWQTQSGDFTQARSSVWTLTVLAPDGTTSDVVLTAPADQAQIQLRPGQLETSVTLTGYGDDQEGANASVGIAITKDAAAAAAGLLKFTGYDEAYPQGATWSYATQPLSAGTYYWQAAPSAYDGSPSAVRSFTILPDRTLRVLVPYGSEGLARDGGAWVHARCSAAPCTAHAELRLYRASGAAVTIAGHASWSASAQLKRQGSAVYFRLGARVAAQIRRIRQRAALRVRVAVTASAPGHDSATAVWSHPVHRFVPPPPHHPPPPETPQERELEEVEAAVSSTLYHDYLISAVFPTCERLDVGYYGCSWSGSRAPGDEYRGTARVRVRRFGLDVQILFALSA